MYHACWYAAETGEGAKGRHRSTAPGLALRSNVLEEAAATAFANIEDLLKTAIAPIVRVRDLGTVRRRSVEGAQHGELGESGLVGLKDFRAAVVRRFPRGAHGHEIAQVLAIHGDEVIEHFKINHSDLARDALQVDASGSRRRSCSSVRTFPDVPATRTGRIEFELARKSLRIDQILHHPFGGWGAADVPKTNKTDAGNRFHARQVYRMKRAIVVKRLIGDVDVAWLVGRLVGDDAEPALRHFG